MADHVLAWQRLVMELSTMPKVLARLMLDHRNDGAGFCRMCLTPGRGTPARRYPCSLATLAEQAILERQRRQPEQLRAIS